MNISQSAIALLYLYAFLLGVCLGGLYDVLRITRIFLGEHYSRHTVARLRAVHLPLIGGYREHRARRALGAVILIEDFLFCIVAGVAFILLHYEAFNGKFRISVLLLSALGFWIYRATLGKPVMLFSETVAFCLEIGFRYAVFFVLFPIRWTGAKLIRLLGQSIGAVLRRRRASARKRYTNRQMRGAEALAADLYPYGGGKGKEQGRVKGKEKAVQPESCDAGVPCGYHRGVACRIYQQRDEVQRASARKGGAGAEQAGSGRGKRGAAGAAELRK